jgi:transcriptional regulator with XRE-family HTH domain
MAASPKSVTKREAPSIAPSLGAPITLGTRLRTEREQKGVALRELARRIGVSPSLISQIERGLVTPSVGTLYAFATELGIELDTLFRDAPFNKTKQAAPLDAPGAASVADQLAGSAPMVADLGASPPSGHVQRKDSRKCIRLAGGVEWERLTAQSDEHVEFLLVRYEVGAESCPEQSLLRHGGKEYAFVMSGRMGVQIGFETYELTAGDSMSFNSQIPHRLWTIGNDPVVAIWTIVNRTNDARGTN